MARKVKAKAKPEQKTKNDIVLLGSLLGQFEEWRLCHRRRNDHAQNLLQDSKEQ